MQAKTLHADTREHAKGSHAKTSSPTMTSDIEIMALVRVLCFDCVVTHVGDNMLKDVSVKLMFRSVCKPLNMSEDVQSVFVTTRRGEERRRHPFIDACRSPHARFT